MNSEVVPARAPVHLHIKPSEGWVSLRLKDLWEYRELLYFFVWRDIKVRYKQTALGAAWAVIQPLATMIVFSIFFGRLAKMPSDGIPYPLFAYVGLVPWTFFAQGLSQSADSLIGNGGLIKKIYFPRMAMPLSTIGAGLMDFSIAFCVFLALMVRYQRGLTWNALLFIPFLVLAMMTSLGAGLWLSAMNVRFRDVKHAVPFLTQFWMYATPIAYPSSLLKSEWGKMLYGLNPMAGVVEGFRWSLLGAKPPGNMVFVSALMSLILLVTGAFYFRRMEKSFADVV
jgi:lipopolysaccharide transport system permease protein